MRHALIAAGLLGLLGCSETLQVLAARDGGAETLPEAAVADAAPDGIVAPVDAGPVDDCGGCGALQLCAAGACVAIDGVRSIAANLQHTCLVEDGRLFCFGKNSGGQLGLGDRVSRTTPTRVGPDNDWLQVTAGEVHSCGLRAPGALYCWGDNVLGQLGLGDTDPRLEPTRVGALDDWDTVACGGESCCALRQGGMLHCWGDNLEGKPAQADAFTKPDVLEPRPAARDLRFSRLAVGQGHVCAIGTDGSLFGWGRNVSGETGTMPGVAQFRAPARVGDADDWVSIAASQHHSCGVRADGTLWCWGKNTHLQLGLSQIPDESPDVLTPARVGADTDWAQVSVGWFHTCALKRDGSMFCMGRAIEGQLGQPPGDPIAEPTRVAHPVGFADSALGNFHTCAVGLDDITYCWGENSLGQLGLGDSVRRSVPTPL